MKSIAHRELRNSSGEVLRRVAAGEEFEVTNRGKVVALLVPARSGDEDGLRRLTRARRVRFSELSRVPSPEATQHILDDLRGER